MPPREFPSKRLVSAAARYGFALLTVALALGVALLAGAETHNLVFPVFLTAISISVWYTGTGPGLLAMLLSALTYNYFFTDPLYSFYIDRSDRIDFIVFVLFAALIGWFSSRRRRIEEALRRARDRLEAEVAERTQQASLLDLTHDTIFVRDMNDVITYWNRGAEELFGWTATEAIGQSAPELLQTVFPMPMAAIREALLAAGRWEGELEKTRADGSRVVVASRWSLRRDEQNRPAAILETNNDITERKRTERQIRRLNEDLGKRSAELEAINKELEAFAYSISHDLRAPLRHMAGYAELLQRRASSLLDEKCRHYMAMILEAAQKMGELIDDLLAFSRIGRAEAQTTRVDLAQLVKEVLSEAQSECDGRQIRWSVGALPALRGDRSMLRLALVNLVANAVKFTRTRAQAEIEIGSIADKNRAPVVFIRDNGVGFDMKYANKLFGVFQRLHRTEEFEGTGIGLATVQRIIHRHGGRVWAEGQPDRGATFYFSVPRAQEEQR